MPALLAFLLAACSVTNVSLVNDHRLVFLTPASRAHLHLPVTLRWSMSGQGARPTTTAGSGTYFAVFVDRPPVEPGQTLRAVAQDDLSCRRTPGCPDAAYFSARQIYTTSSESIVLDRVDDLADNRQQEQLHEATVVLMGPGGRRAGESAWYRDFWLPKAGQS